MNENCKYENVERPGLYILIFILLFQQCQDHNTINKIESKLNNMSNQIERIINNIK